MLGSSVLWVLLVLASYASKILADSRHDHGAGAAPPPLSSPTQRADPTPAVTFASARNALQNAGALESLTEAWSWSRAEPDGGSTGEDVGFAAAMDDEIAMTSGHALPRPTALRMSYDVDHDAALAGGIVTLVGALVVLAVAALVVDRYRHRIRAPTTDSTLTTTGNLTPDLAASASGATSPPILRPPRRRYWLIPPPIYQIHPEGPDSVLPSRVVA